MKATLLLAAAFAFTTSAALAQTVAPGTTPGAQTGNPSNMPSAGTNSTTAVDPTSNSTRMDNMSGSDRKAMRKSKKMKSHDGSMKTKTKM